MKAVRTYTEQLEKTIAEGVELRDQMRQKISTMEAVIAAQKRDLDNALDAKELFRKRAANYKQRNCRQREKIQKLEGQVIKLQKKAG